MEALGMKNILEGVIVMKGNETEVDKREMVEAVRPTEQSRIFRSGVLY